MAPGAPTGRKIGCFLLTEPDAGSDAGGIATTYKREGDRIRHQRQQDLHHQRRLSGHRRAARDLFDRSLKHKGISAFIVDLKSPGVTILKNENKMGIRGSYTTAFAFDNLRVPVENLLGQEGKGFKSPWTP